MLDAPTEAKYSIRLPLQSLMKGRTSPLYFRELDKIIRGEFNFGRQGQVCCNDLYGWTGEGEQPGSVVSREHLLFQFDEQNGNFGVRNIGRAGNPVSFQSRQQAESDLASTKVSPADGEMILGMLNTDEAARIKLPSKRFQIDTGDNPSTHDRILRFTDSLFGNSRFNSSSSPTLDFSNRDCKNDIWLDISPIADQSRLVPAQSPVLESLPLINGTSPYHVAGRAKAGKTQFDYEPGLVAADEFTLHIGRDSGTSVQANFTSDNSRISSDHLELTIDKQASRAIVRDLKSTYGSYIWYHDAKPSLDEFKPKPITSDQEGLALDLNKGWTICLAGAMFIRNDARSHTLTISEPGKDSVVINTQAKQ